MARATLSALFVGICLLAARSSLGTGMAVHWRQLVHAPGVVDVVGPRADGRFVVATRQGVFLMRRSGSLTPFARGNGGYAGGQGEPYIALAQQRHVRGAGCSSRRDDIYALDATRPGVVLIGRSGRSRRFADLPAGSVPSAIAFDAVGRFGHRLLVTVLVSNRTTLYALDCRGRARVVVRGAAKIEGGAAVAPATAGVLHGHLIAADEVTGRVYSFGAGGRVRLVARPDLPAGQDIGIESVGFVPSRFTRRGAAYLADLGAPGSPTEGTESVLELPGKQLVRVGVRAGDLLLATEARGITLAVRCIRRCTARRIGQALEPTHGEGHIAFTR